MFERLHLCVVVPCRYGSKVYLDTGLQVFAAGKSDAPVYALFTPGSMFDVDIMENANGVCVSVCVCVCLCVDVCVCVCVCLRVRTCCCVCVYARPSVRVRASVCACVR